MSSLDVIKSCLNSLVARSLSFSLVLLHLQADYELIYCLGMGKFLDSFNLDWKILTIPLVSWKELISERTGK